VEVRKSMPGTVKRGMRVGFIAMFVLWQAASCCCLLGGAVSPTVPTYPVSRHLARQMRDRVSEAVSREGAFSVQITDRELTSYVVALLQSGAGEFPARDMQIVFGDGSADIWATFIEVAPADIPAYMRVEITASNGALVFRIARANAGIFPIPGAWREAISQILSETLAEQQLGLEIEHVRVTPGQMTVEGFVTGAVPALPSRW
jgi:hypothetical protein